jgi:RNA polymerase sigma-70 factor (ECF subfamily)
VRAVVEAYLGQIVRAGRGAGLSAEEAEDVAQATFATFLEKADRFEGRSHVRTWLFGILYRKIKESRRNRHREEPVEDIEEALSRRFDEQGRWTRPPRSADSRLYDAQVREHVGACLETCPDSQRMAFVFREVEGLSSDEICKIMEITRTNLGVLLHRARNRLRECLEARGIGSETP